MKYSEISKTAARIAASEVKVGDILRSPHTPSYWGKVERIESESRLKKITFHVLFIAGEASGQRWHYTFLKTTQVVYIKNLNNE